ncbi:MAG: hypothetical protein V7K40_21055 [Nostoc sp.]|uniref:hypothetical protein n=1 Tax=Nostoc sp. TaxID=1180 RepID=UPI002FF95786
MTGSARGIGLASAIKLAHRLHTASAPQADQLVMHKFGRACKHRDHYSANSTQPISEGLRQESKNIRVTTISPGVVETEFASDTTDN